MFHWVAEELRHARSLIVESNFTAAAAPSFAKLPAHRSLQLFCTAPRELVIERYAARSRHEGHLDDVILDELRAGRHEDQWSPLPLARLLAQVRALLRAGSQTGEQALT